MSPELLKIYVNILLTLHLIWIVFLIIGGLLILRWSFLVWIHMGGLLFSLFLNLLDLYCPLTYLEDIIRTRTGVRLYGEESFLSYYLRRIIYPDIDQEILRIGEIIFVLFYFCLYVWILKHIMAGKKSTTRRINQC